MADVNRRPEHGEILDIGGKRMIADVGELLIEVLAKPNDPEMPPTLPDELLYADGGLELWNTIIWQQEWYQTHDEIALFDAHGSDIVSRVLPGVTMIDLGAG